MRRQSRDLPLFSTDGKGLDGPVLLPISRKTVIGDVLGIDTPAERDAGTIACLVRGLVARANIFRVHHVRAVADSVRVIAAIRGEYSRGYSHSSSPSPVSRGG